MASGCGTTGRRSGRRRPSPDEGVSRAGVGARTSLGCQLWSQPRRMSQARCSLLDSEASSNLACSKDGRRVFFQLVGAVDRFSCASCSHPRRPRRMTLHLVLARLLRELIELAEQEGEIERVSALHDTLSEGERRAGIWPAGSATRERRLQSPTRSWRSTKGCRGGPQTRPRIWMPF